MEQTLIDDIVSILEDYAVQNEFDGFLKIQVDDVAKAIEKMLVLKMNEQKKQLRRQLVKRKL